MSRLWWTAVAVFLTAQSIDAVDKKKLAWVVSQVLNLYKPTETQPDGSPIMFSLALSIPFNQQTQQYNLDEVTDLDDPGEVRAALDNHQVYTGHRVVGATVLKHDNYADHAEYRVLQNFDTLVSQNSPANRNTDLMLFYVFPNPCITTYMNPRSDFNIIEAITQIRQWQHFAFVFTDRFVPYGSNQRPEITERNTFRSVNSLVELLGLTNIYCYRPYRCIRCYTNGGLNQINEKCVRGTVQ